MSAPTDDSKSSNSARPQSDDPWGNVFLTALREEKCRVEAWKEQVNGLQLWMGFIAAVAMPQLAASLMASLALCGSVTFLGWVSSIWIREYVSYPSGQQAKLSMSIFDLRKEGLESSWLPFLLDFGLPTMACSATLLCLVHVICFYLSVQREVFAVPASGARNLVAAVSVIAVVFLTLLVFLVAMAQPTVQFLASQWRRPVHADFLSPYKSPPSLFVLRWVVISFRAIQRSRGLPTELETKTLVSWSSHDQAFSESQGRLAYKDLANPHEAGALSMCAHLAAKCQDSGSKAWMIYHCCRDLAQDFIGHLQEYDRTNDRNIGPAVIQNILPGNRLWAFPNFTQDVRHDILLLSLLFYCFPGRKPDALFPEFARLQFEIIRRVLGHGLVDQRGYAGVGSAAIVLFQEEGMISQYGKKEEGFACRVLELLENVLQINTSVNFNYSFQGGPDVSRFLVEAAEVLFFMATMKEITNITCRQLVGRLLEKNKAWREGSGPTTALPRFLANELSKLSEQVDLDAPSAASIEERLIQGLRDYRSASQDRGLAVVGIHDELLLAPDFGYWE